jgi:hypothetical protein
MVLRWKLALLSCLVLCLTLAGASLFSQTGKTPAPGRTLVRAGHLLDVKTGKLLDGQTIVVVGDKIQSIGPTSEVAAQPAIRWSIWAG